jgi:hypothetical protein
MRILLILIAAILIPAAVIAGYVWFNREPIPYTGQVVSVNAYPIHRDLTSKTTTQGIGGQNETYDEVIVLADVRVKDVAKIPLFLQDISATANLPDESDTSTAASAPDFQNVFLAYPDLKQYQKAPLPRDLTLQPGQEAEGQMVFNYEINQAQWNSRTGMDINLSFLHHPPLVLHVAK